MRILMIEDDKELCLAVSSALAAEGLSCDMCHSGGDWQYYLSQNIYDVCILDRMLPCVDGLTILNKARKCGITTPILMLTALGRTSDKIDGLNAGADDYLTKPFDMRELIARLNALARRPTEVELQAVLCAGNATLNAAEMLLQGTKAKLLLSKKECELLEVFFKNEGKLLSRNLLLGRVWGANAEVEEASLDSYIHFVRRRLTAAGTNLKLTTVRGGGYKLEVQHD